MAILVNGVPDTRQVNSHELKTDVVVSKADVGLSNVANFGFSSTTTDPSNEKYATAGAVKLTYDLAARKLDATANAVSATKLQTVRTIAGVPFDGTSNITISAANVGALSLNGGTMTGMITLSRKVAQFRGPQNGATPLNDLYSTESGCWSYSSNISRGVANEFPGVNNANAVLTFNTHTGDYGHQIGFSSNEKLYHRYWKAAAWKEIVRCETDGTLNVKSLGVTEGAAVGSLSVAGATTLNGDAKSTAANYLTCTYGGQYGLIHRHDGISYYMLLTNKDDPNGNWNSFRPFRLDLASGRIEMQRGVTASQLTVGGNITGSGGIVLDNTNNDTYGMTKWSNDTNAGAKSYLRGWRNYNAGTKWHETVDANVYRIATGVSDSNELLSLNGNGEFRINGPVYSSRSGSGVAAQVSARNSSTSVGVSEFRMEVHGNGNINLTTHDGSRWFYPFSFDRTSADVHANGHLNIGGNIILKQGGGSNSPITLRNWGNASSGRMAVLEIGDSKGYYMYAQRQSDNAILFSVNGVINTGNTRIGSSGTLIALDSGATLGNAADNALLRGAIDGGNWTAWADRAAGMRINVNDSANKAYNIWKAVHPGKYALAAMQIHCPGSSNTSAIARLQVGDTATFDYKGSGDFEASRNGNFNDVYIRSDGRLKINRDEVRDALVKVSKLEVYTYDKLADLGSDVVVGREIGIIAQSLKSVVPEAVNTNDETGLLTISNSGVNALLVKAIQEMKLEIEKLKTMIGA